MLDSLYLIFLNLIVFTSAMSHEVKPCTILQTRQLDYLVISIFQKFNGEETETANDWSNRCHNTWSKDARILLNCWSSQNVIAMEILIARINSTRHWLKHTPAFVTFHYKLNNQMCLPNPHVHWWHFNDNFCKGRMLILEWWAGATILMLLGCAVTL